MIRATTVISVVRRGLARPSPMAEQAPGLRLVRTVWTNPAWKGKQRALDNDAPSQAHSDAYDPRAVFALSRRDTRLLARKRIELPQRLRVGYIGTRNFHATSSRLAVPLIPAGAAILKSTSVLTIITFISRVLISFFPLGTIAAFRNMRFVKWWSAEERKPTVGPEAEEFYLMWCQGEKSARLTNEEARRIIDKGVQGENGGVTVEGDDRIAWHHPWPPWRGPKSYNKFLDPAVIRENKDGGFRANPVRFIRETRFYLRPLPPASVSYFEAMSPQEQAEVTELRRYWASMRAFKDELRMQRIVVFALLILPCLLLAGVYAAALERVPFTGRWRIILLTADDEYKISSSLAGPNWYKAVINLLTTPETPAPPVVPLTDWRWKWVEGILRRLEQAAVEAAQAAERGEEDAKWDFSTGIPRPPPSKYPLRPVARVSTRLHGALPGGDPALGREHLEFGPPFSLMLMEKADRNAFSYGFGGKGAGGIVVFTGLLDDILAHDTASEEPQAQPAQRGLFSGLFSSPAQPTSPRQPTPTEEQSLHLACVLAHEMGHLLLGHHLETLSQQQVLWPSLLGLSMDLVRAFIWPFTIFLGPAVNDALANMGRTSTDELIDRYGAIGFQFKHEFEADLVGLRILARAGYSPEAALKHFANSIPDLHEIQPLDKDDTTSWTGSLFKLWTQATHPSREKRLEAVKEELATWTPAEAATS